MSSEHSISDEENYILEDIDPHHTGTLHQRSKSRSRAIHARLPSIQAIHSVGGATFARKKLAEQRSQIRRSNSDETHEETHDGYLNTAADTAFIEDGVNYTTLTLQTKSYLDGFTYKDLNTLRELNCSMEKKKKIRKKLLADHDRTEAKLNVSTNSKTNWHKLKGDFKDAVYHLELWRSSIHEIEGRFGTGIRSYFTFLRWLFILNFYIFLLIFAFVVVPTFVFELYKNSNFISISDQGRNISAECMYNPYNPSSIASFSQYVIWWFTGQGFMENTLLFSGYYDNAKTTVTAGGINFYYDLPLAYLLVAFFYFALSLTLIVYRASAGMKRSLAVDDQLYSYCNLVFSGWDYCITDDKASTLKQKSLKFELQANLDDEKIKDRQAKRTRNDKIVLYAKRILVNILSILIVGGALIAIFFAAQFALQSEDLYRDNFLLDLIVTYLTSIVITAVNFVAPFIFEMLVVFEDYSPEFAIRITLIRIVALRLASVVSLYVVVYLQINCQLILSNRLDKDCDFCKGTQCWETYLGQEMYKLTLFDFLAVVGVTLLVEFPRKLVVDHCSCGLAKWLGQQEFSIPTNVLDIVYAQTLGWIGAFYAPLLPVMLVIKFFIYFYLKKLTLVYNCRPSTRPYRASKFASFFFIMLIIALGVAILPVIVSVASIEPSADCGPFRGWATMFDAITLSIQTNLVTSLQDVLFFLGTSGFAVIVIVILCLILYYYFALGSAHKELIILLRNQLTLEGKDKQFLLLRFNQLNEELQQHQLLYNFPSNPNGNGRTNPAFEDERSELDLPGQTSDSY